MKKHEILFSIVKIPLDFFGVLISFYLARELRLITDGIPGVVLPIQTIPSESLIYYALSGASLYILLFGIHGLYSLTLSNSKISEYGNIIRYGVYWFFFFAVGVYLGNGFLYSGNEIPRLIILFSGIGSIFWSILFRFLLHLIGNILIKKNILKKRNILLISGIQQKELDNIIGDIGCAQIYNICGYINSQNIGVNTPYLGTSKHLENVIREHNVDELLVLNSDFSKSEMYHIWEISRIYGVRYRYMTHTFDITKTNTSLSLLYQIPTVEINTTPLQNWNRIIKRIFDICLSFCILVIISPVLVIIALLIKFEDPHGPVIYKNIRIGQNRKLFSCYKFRYLKWKYCIKENYGIAPGNDRALKYEKELIQKQNTRSGPLYKIENDPRKTKLGNFLEKYSLDEIPQFWNVFVGDMSIVGPRPHQPREVQKYEKYQKRLLTIKPGITGMAQVNGREKNNFEKEAELDIFYIENWSFLLDIKIILKTLPLIFSRR